jgi:hypothetical protein
MAKGRCLWGIQHWRELLSQSEVCPETVEVGWIEIDVSGTRNQESEVKETTQHALNQ